MEHELVLNPAAEFLPAECGTAAVARVLGLSVRSVQLMADRGEIQSWKTAGGHRRISRTSVLQWLLLQHGCGQSPAPAAAADFASHPLESACFDWPTVSPLRYPRCALLIEDSPHFQSFVRLFMAQEFPQVDVYVAGDATEGMVLAGQLRPDVLIVDMLLLGGDEVAWVSRLRQLPPVRHCRCIFMTSAPAPAPAPAPESIDGTRRAARAPTVSGQPIVHKSRLAQDLPVLLSRALA